ncbi:MULTISPECIES: magnesium transporter [unclassified Iodidimonas]|uniref:magnesium transporter n=1 Tax=unclassified Iodidimonas TaxID=2626145 RepID=UPI002482D2A6|nr:MULTISPECIES: magnesium transporter [unclassified Iodidimonas]
MSAPEDQDDLMTKDPERAQSEHGGDDQSQSKASEIAQDLNYGMDIHLQPDFVRAVIEAVHAEDRELARSLVAEQHVADIADLFEVLPPEERRTLAVLVADSLDPIFLSELEGAAFDDVIRVISPQVIADAVQQLDTDDAVYILEDLDADAQHQVLHALTREDRMALEEGLAFPEDSAGRLMQRDLVAVPEFWSVGQTIDYLRAHDDHEQPRDFYELIVIDPTYRPIGTVPLSRLLGCQRPVRIRDVMTPEPHIVSVSTDQEEVARQFAKYHLISAGVVNEHGRLVGVITVDDIVGVIEDEASEDILALAGVSEGDVNNSIRDVTRTRFIWLFVNMGTAILASMVIGLFEATLETMVALAVLMPIVASMGGNAGTQTMAVAVRALATKELSPANAMRIVNKELMVALINGAALAVIVGFVGIIWFGDILLAFVLAAAMIINIVMAGLSGILIPMMLDRFGIDPAVASSVFVTTITDVVGFFAFLGLASLILL